MQAAFWLNHDRFLKNALITEQPHPETTELSHLAQTDLPSAISLLLKIDIAVVQKLQSYSSELEALHKAIHQTLKAGHKVFIAGCGASGRLAASLEYCWRKQYPDNTKQVVSIIAGGDAALIRSIERCEDYPEYGIKQLRQQGFSENDLLISSAAGGESPFILGATDYAAGFSHQKPWLLYCNPNEALLGRNPKHPISNPNVRGLYLETGPMALTGSTRMQTTTMMLLCIGLALFYSESEIPLALETLLTSLKTLDLTGIAPLIEAEASCYQNHQTMLYKTSAENGLTILNDTTERSPTFNLLPFENQRDQPIKPAWCYVNIIGTHTAAESWRALVNREVMALNWPELPATELGNLLGFDLSDDYTASRQSAYSLSILPSKSGFEFVLSGLTSHRFELALPGLNFFQQQIVLKLTLNNLSTLVMGRLGFYRGNLMTSLYPSNHKLIDRAIRYTRYRYQQQTGTELPYKEVADAVFAEMQNLQPGESIVDKSLASLKAKLKLYTLNLLSQRQQ